MRRESLGAGLTLSLEHQIWKDPLITKSLSLSLSPEPPEVVSGASPSLEVIHLHTKSITQCIQELLQAAQTQRQSRWDWGGGNYWE